MLYPLTQGRAVNASRDDAVKVARAWIDECDEDSKPRAYQDVYRRPADRIFALEYISFSSLAAIGVAITSMRCRRSASAAAVIASVRIDPKMIFSRVVCARVCLGYSMTIRWGAARVDDMKATAVVRQYTLWRRSRIGAPSEAVARLTRSGRAAEGVVRDRTRL